MTFYNRTDELAALEERWLSQKAEYMVIYGRRRVGKSGLILRFAKDKRCLYFEATSGTKNDHLEDASSALAEMTGRKLFVSESLTSWQGFLDAIAEELDKGPLLVSFDEFQFVAREAKDIGSLINRFWRDHKDNPNLMLILSGSDISFFAKEVMGYAATTYGRRTGSLRLRPFPPFEIKHFLPNWTPEDLIRVYAVFGGVPYYLEALDPTDSLPDSIQRHILAPDALLREEPRFLFSQQSEMRDDSVYFSILRALASGQTRRNEIATRIGRSGDATGQLLGKLIEMGLVKRMHPITTLHPDRSRNVRFSIDDPFLRFWFSFVHPFEGRLHTRADASKHLKKRVLPQLDHFVSKPTFEHICQEWLKESMDAAAGGWWWGSVKERTPDGLRNISREIDVVAVDENSHVLALGSCKWTAGPMRYSEKAQLRRLAGQICTADEEPALYFFSRSGFDRKLLQECEADPKCHLVSVADLLS